MSAPAVANTSLFNPFCSFLSAKIPIQSSLFVCVFSPGHTLPSDPRYAPGPMPLPDPPFPGGQPPEQAQFTGRQSFNARLLFFRIRFHAGSACFFICLKVFQRVINRATKTNKGQTLYYDMNRVPYFSAAYNLITSFFSCQSQVVRPLNIQA